MHLTAHDKKYKNRNEDYRAIMSGLTFKRGLNYLPKYHE
jgi:hypothetical protein